jgi:nucleotide-binding universal stress UspA family protein
MRAAELAVDVARKLEADLTAVAVEPPDFVVGAEYREKLLAVLEAVKAKAHLYSRRIDTRLVEGNPVNQVLQQAANFDLLIVAHRRGRRFSLTRPDVSRHLIVRAPCSVMILPFQESDLPHGG